MTRFVSSLAFKFASRILNPFFAGFSPSVTLPVIILASTVTFIAATEASHGRSIYLNGVDISNARNQSLEGVDIRIDAEGNVFIIGNHYEIYQQEPVAPLVPRANLPRTPPGHKPKSKLPGAEVNNPAGHPPLPPSYRSGKAGAKSQKPPVAAKGQQNQQGSGQSAKQGG